MSVRTSSEKRMKRSKMSRLDRIAQHASTLLRVQKRFRALSRQIEKEFAGLGRLSQGIEHDIEQIRDLLLEPTIRSKRIVHLAGQLLFDSIQYGETQQALEALLRARSEEIQDLV
jgi:hypothetical protein